MTDEKPIFTKNADWFSGKIPLWRDMFDYNKPKHTPLRYLEIGAFEGRAVIWMLNRVLKDPKCRVVLVEPGMLHDKVLEYLKHNLKGFPHDIQILEAKSDVLNDMDEVFDIIYVDGAHTESVVYMDGTNAYRMIAPGGLIIFDDYEWLARYNPPLSPDGTTPKAAIDRLLKEWGDSVELLHKAWQVWVRKK